TVPAHNLFAPVRACVMAAARFMPSVCGVLESSWSTRIIFTPCSRQSIFGTLLTMTQSIAGRLRRKGLAVFIAKSRVYRFRQQLRRSGQKEDHRQETGVQYRELNIRGNAFLAPGSEKTGLFFRRKLIRPKMVGTEESMSMSSRMQVTGSDIFDPMTPSNLQEPFVFFAKLRKEKPVYWNEQYSFWMLTRYQDVKAALRAPRQFSSATGIEIEKRAQQIPQCARASFDINKRFIYTHM